MIVPARTMSHLNPFILHPTSSTSSGNIDNRTFPNRVNLHLAIMAYLEFPKVAGQIQILLYDSKFVTPWSWWWDVRFFWKVRCERADEAGVWKHWTS